MMQMLSTIINCMLDEKNEVFIPWEEWKKYKPGFPVVCHVCHKFICFKESYSQEVWICNECRENLAGNGHQSVNKEG